MIELLKNNEEEALFSKTLATIRTDAPINFKLPEKTFWENADLKKIETVFSLFEFRSLFARLKIFLEKTRPEIISPSFAPCLGRARSSGVAKIPRENPWSAQMVNST